MKRDALTLFLLIAFAVFVGWHFGCRFASLETAHCGMRADLSDHEKRLLPLEQDLQRRQNLRGRVSGVLTWLKGKIGF